MKKFKHGLILGKFLPFHRGHQFLIEFAISQCDNLTVLVCTLRSETIPGGLRYEWIHSFFPEINVIHITDEIPGTPEEDPNFWISWTDLLKKHISSDTEVFFSSEDYGKEIGDRLGLQHIEVDKERQTFPTSGTKIRENPFRQWEFIPEIVRPYFVKRISIMGPESVGKSVLTKKLAEYYHTNFVEEYGRTVFENNGNKIEIKDFIPISYGRQKIENEKIKKANKILFCDTEDITTYIWSKFYFPNEYKSIENYFLNKISTNTKYDLYIILYPDCEAIQDGTRMFLDKREEHYDKIKKYLFEKKCNFVEIGGNWENRFQKSIEHVNKFL